MEDSEVVTTHPLWRPFSDNANHQRQITRTAYRQTPPGPPEPHRTTWATQFALMHQVITRTIPDQVIHISHIGSTAVPHLLAKPVIDIDLTVPDVADEAAYVPQLESAGFRLIFRDDVAGDKHRQFTFGDPNTNLHLWEPNAIEPRRHEMFVAWLRSDAQDRQLYADAKQAALESDGNRRYNDLKAAVVYDIYERIFLADTAHPHHPRPRR
jgi:GrpB-like predicted nucleotidyltransferase (UPF0157 family)